MKVKKMTTKYGYDVAICPFCQETFSMRFSNPVGALQRHIKNQAKNEALAVFVGDIAKENASQLQHMHYYKQHTSKKMVVVTDTRNFDGELTIE